MKSQDTKTNKKKDHNSWQIETVRGKPNYDKQEDKKKTGKESFTRKGYVAKSNDVHIHYSSRVVQNPRSQVLRGAVSIPLNRHINDLIDEFSKLEDNWDFEESIAPSQNVISKAKEITSIFEDFSVKLYHAAPGPNGEVMLSIRNEKNSKSIEIIIYDEIITIVYISDTNCKQDSFNLADINNYINWLKS